MDLTGATEIGRAQHQRRHPDTVSLSAPRRRPHRGGSGTPAGRDRTGFPRLTPGRSTCSTPPRCSRPGRHRKSRSGRPLMDVAEFAGDQPEPDGQRHDGGGRIPEGDPQCGRAGAAAHPDPPTDAGTPRTADQRPSPVISRSPAHRAGRGRSSTVPAGFAGPLARADRPDPRPARP